MIHFLHNAFSCYGVSYGVSFVIKIEIDGLKPKRHNPIANTLELCLFYTNLLRLSDAYMHMYINQYWFRKWFVT